MTLRNASRVSSSSMWATCASSWYFLAVAAAAGAHDAFASYFPRTSCRWRQRRLPWPRKHDDGGRQRLRAGTREHGSTVAFRARRGLSLVEGSTNGTSGDLARLSSMQHSLEDRLKTLDFEFAQTYLVDNERCVERQRELVSRLEDELREANRLLSDFEQRLATQVATRDRIVSELNRMH